MSGPIVGHVGSDRRACRAQSSGMSGLTSVGSSAARNCPSRLPYIYALRGLSQIVFPTVSVIMTLSPDPPPLSVTAILPH